MVIIARLYNIDMHLNKKLPKKCIITYGCYHFWWQGSNHGHPYTLGSNLKNSANVGTISMVWASWFLRSSLNGISSLWVMHIRSWTGCGSVLIHRLNILPIHSFSPIKIKLQSVLTISMVFSRGHHIYPSYLILFQDSGHTYHKWGVFS